MIGQLPDWFSPPPPAQQQTNWWAPPKDEASALPYLTIGTALQNLGNIWSNPGSQQNIMAGFAPLLQMKQGLADRKKMQDVIGQMQGLDPNVKAAMGLIPETALAAYVKNATEQQSSKIPPLMSTGRGIWDTRLNEGKGGILPGTEPFPPNLQLKPIQTGTDISTLLFDPRSGEGSPIASGPKWNPDIQHGAGAGGPVPAGHIQALNITKIAPDGTPYTETQLVDMRPQRGGPTQMSMVPAPWQQDQAAASPYTSKEAAPKALPTAAQDDFKAALSGVRSLDTMEENLKQTGRAKGQVSRLGAMLGTNKAAIEFETAQKNQAIAAQKLVPGIPSNKDSERLDATMPSLTISEAENKSRIDFHRQTMRELVKLKIGSYKGAGYKIPADVGDLAKKLGVDSSAAPALSEDAVQAGTDAWRAKADAFVAQQRNQQLKSAAPPPAAAAPPPKRIKVDVNGNIIP